MMLQSSRLVILAGFFTLATSGALAQDQRSEERDAAKYYQKWLNQDVVYIITDEEREVFNKLSTLDEKDQFIEQFWQRRDPDLTTALNEYKEEHYRRLAYVNAKFGSGVPGWKTDRGRVYVMFGEPVHIEYNAGGPYIRKPWEGGGRTATFPFEVWNYRHIDGVGDDVEIEFVDRSFTGEFKMVMYPWEKDMNLYHDGEGQTLSEKLGLTKREYRPGLHPGFMNDVNYQTRNFAMRQKDAPFERLTRFFNLQRPPEIKHKELQEIVEARVTYDVLPIDLHLSHIWVDESTILMPITLQVENTRLQFVEKRDIFKARVGIYGRVTAMTGELVAEFEETLASEYKKSLIMYGRLQKSVFQKIVAAAPGRYKIELVVKDLNSGSVGTKVTSVHIPAMNPDEVVFSPIVLATQLEHLDAFPNEPTTFVIGDVRVIPNVLGRFRPSDELGVYCQVHNLEFDSSTFEPDVEIDFDIQRKGENIEEIRDTARESVAFASPARVVVARKIPLAKLSAGRYELVVTVHDRLSRKTAESRTTFQVIGTDAETSESSSGGSR